MASKVQRRVSLRRKFKLLRSVAHSKSVSKSSIILDAHGYINQLKIKLETLNLEYANLISHPIQVPTEVNVKKTEKGFQVGVKCEKGRDLLVCIIEALELRGLDVVQANVSCDQSFFMEAIAEAQDQAQDARDVKEAVFNAIAKHVYGGR